MRTKSKGRQRPQSLADFLNSPSGLSSIPPPSPASTMASTPRENGFVSPSPREVWANSPRSIMTPPSREGNKRDENGRLLISTEECRKRSMPPVAPPVPVPRQPKYNHDGSYSRNIFKEACNPGTEIAHIEDETTRRKLTKKIENFVDWMASQHVPNGFWTGKQNPFKFHESLCTKRQTGSLCNKGTKCKKLPDHDIQKSFIPQLYHLLQDYGFFLLYMNIVNNDEKDKDMKKLRKNVTDWCVDIAEGLAKYKRDERIRRYKEMLTKIRRVQFLRTFDAICCRNKERNHKSMDEFLDEIYGVVERKVERLEKNLVYNV